MRIILSSVEPAVGEDEDEAAIEGRGDLEALRAGDENAFAELVRSHRRRVHAVCLRFTGSATDAEDLVQDVFLRAYRGLSGFRGDAKLSTWLYRIATNTCLSWLSSQRAGALLGEELPPELADPAPTPAERLRSRETSRIVRAAVAELPEKQRLTLLLRVYAELTYREIAEAMDCPVGTAKANFFFALKNLRKRLDPGAGFDGPMKEVSRRSLGGGGGRA